MKDAEPSHSDREFCERYRREHPEVANAAAASQQGAQTRPAAQKTEDDNEGPLAFTGLELWQLLLLAAVLIGGGIGARRLLAN